MVPSLAYLDSTLNHVIIWKFDLKTIWKPGKVLWNISVVWIFCKLFLVSCNICIYSFLSFILRIISLKCNCTDNCSKNCTIIIIFYSNVLYFLLFLCIYGISSADRENTLQQDVKKEEASVTYQPPGNGGLYLQSGKDIQMSYKRA